MSQVRPNYSQILTKANLIKYLLYVFCYITLYICIQIFVLHGIYQNAQEDYYAKLDTIVETEGVDLNLMCNILKCDKVQASGVNYVSKKGIIRQTTISGDYQPVLFNINKDFETIIIWRDIKFIADNSKLFDIVYKLLLVSMTVFVIMGTILYYSKLVAENRRAIMEKGGLKTELESRLQRDITESLHHEMGAPIAVISTLIDGIFRRLYPCAKTKNGICDFDNVELPICECQGCPLIAKRRDIDEIASSYYARIKMNLGTLGSLQNVIAGAKHIKYSNGTVSVFSIIENIIASNNSFMVNKVRARYKNEKVLKSYACGIGLANGELLMGIHAMVVNSMEANSTEIEFSGEVSGRFNDKLSIFMSDNGRGIRDKDGNVIHDNSIFNYGYSTKDSNGNVNMIKTLFKRVYYEFAGINELSSRGVGLSVNKRLLNNSGGDIVLLETSTKGTKFKIVIPTKPRRG